MSRLRLGFAGLGDIAGYMALFARLNRQIKIAACCDISSEKVKHFAARNHVSQTFTDYAQMLEKAQLDAVYLAIPHDLHADMIRQALDTGLAVFVEKPITCQTREALSIIEQASRLDIPLAVNYQYRYDSGCFALAHALQEKALGKVHYARINVPWKRQESYFTQAAWHANRDQSCGGTLLTHASHFLDIVLWGLDSPVRRVQAITKQMVFHQSEVEDLAMAVFELENGALIELTSSMISTPEQAVRIDVYGERGTARYSDRPLPHTRFLGVRVKRSLPPVPGLHALQRSLEGFRRWAAGGPEHLVPAISALPVLAAIETAYHAAQSGQWETISLQDI